MKTARVVPSTSVLALTLAVAGCGSAPAPAPTAHYSAEELNNAARPGLPEEDPDAPLPATTAASAQAVAPPPMAAVRVIHASPDRPLASVDLYLNDQTTPAATALAYRSITGALRVTPGEHAVPVRIAGTAATEAAPATAHTPALEGDHRYTVIAHTGAHGVAFAAADDDLAAPDAGHAKVRFFHAVVGVPAVDVCRPATPARAAAAGHPAEPAHPATAVFANVAPGTFGTEGYVDVVGGAAVTLQLRGHGARPCAGAALGAVTFTPADRSVTTAVAVGRTTPPAAPRALLLCSDGTFEGEPTCVGHALTPTGAPPPAASSPRPAPPAR